MPAKLITYNSQYYAGTLGSGLLRAHAVALLFNTSYNRSACAYCMALCAKLTTLSTAILWLAV